jgi:adenylosuccinate synthase
MTNEGLYDLNLKNNELETNVTNEWQGDFRSSVLDLDLLKYALQCDSNFSAGIQRNMVITCLDQIGEEYSPKIPVTINEKLHYISPEELVEKLPDYINKVHFSRGDTKEHISIEMARLDGGLVRA